MASNEKSRPLEDRVPPGDVPQESRGGWYRRWIDDTSDDVANGMEGEPERQERMNDLHHRLDQLHRRLSQLPGGQRGRGPRGYVPSDQPGSEDERIREGVKRHLTDDWHLDATDIDVAVTNGEVTLTGTVDSRIAKCLAEDCADSVLGVRDVTNNLRIR